MAFEIKDNTGFLHKNKYKKENKHPSYTGYVVVNGKKMRCSLWYNKEKDYFFLGFSEPYVKPEVKDDELTQSDKINLSFEEEKNKNLKELENDLPF